MFRVKIVPNDGWHTIGEEGLIIEGTEHWAYPTPVGEDYNGLAHDIFEHIGEQNGTAEDELRAFGASLFGRYNLGLTHSERDIGIEIGSFVRHHLEVPNTIKVRGLVHELQDYLWEGIVKESNNVLATPLPKNMKRIIMHWLYKGYMQAQRRYKNSACLVNMYKELQRQLKEKLKYVELENIKHIWINYDPKTEYVNVRVVEHPLYY